MDVWEPSEEMIGGLEGKWLGDERDPGDRQLDANLSALFRWA